MASKFLAKARGEDRPRSKPDEKDIQGFLNANQKDLQAGAGEITTATGYARGGKRPVLGERLPQRLHA